MISHKVIGGRLDLNVEMGEIYYYWVSEKNGSTYPTTEQLLEKGDYLVGETDAFFVGSTHPARLGALLYKPVKLIKKGKSYRP